MGLAGRIAEVCEVHPVSSKLGRMRFIMTSTTRHLLAGNLPWPAGSYSRIEEGSLGNAV